MKLSNQFIAFRDKHNLLPDNYSLILALVQIQQRNKFSRILGIRIAAEFSQAMVRFKNAFNARFVT
jgi:hypothetical protein